MFFFLNNISIISSVLKLTLYDDQLCTSFGIISYGALVMFVSN